ncbi:MAG TPA: methyl-accepting chemotaxis protein [Blastocatellia bacterium]|nr:methyl-accepting chemotaxis protein [Blastocatellia bacterium]
MQLKSIQTKITFWVGSCLVVVGIIFLSYSAYTTRNAALEAAQNQAIAQAKVEAGRVRAQLEQALNVTKTVTQTLVSAKAPNGAFKLSREGANTLMKQILAENPHFVAFYSDWEPNAFDGQDAEYGGKPGYNSDGRFNFTWSYNEKGELKSDVTPPGDEDTAEWYQVPKKALRESIIEPSPYLVQNKEVLKTTLVTPIIIGNKFHGVVGADIKIDFLQKLADEINLYNRAGKLMLLSHKGVIAGLTGRPDAVHKPLQTIFPGLAEDLGKITGGREDIAFIGDNMRILVPLQVGKTNTPWAVCILIPTSVVTAQARTLLWQQLLIFTVLLIAALAMVWYLSSLLARPIKTAVQFANNLAQGISTSPVPVTTSDETGQLLAAMNSMLDSADSLVQSEEKQNELQTSIIRLLDQVGHIAQGDLTREVTVSGDVTGTLADSFNYMITELRRIIGQVQAVTEQVAKTTGATQRNTTDLAHEAEAQVEQIAQTTRAIEAMANSIRQVTEGAVLSATVAQQSLNNAKQGTEAVQNTIEGMQRIREQVQETSKKLKRLGESSQEIGEIVQIIGSISKRTSYLALNAAIQAAEAGETGHGFTVVAEEIERLAKRSAEATKSINNLVKAIQMGANEAISAMEESTREVVSGSQLAQQAGQALHEIEAVSERLADLIATISQASTEQNQSSTTVAQAMAQISAITQRTTEGIKQSSASVQNMANLADELRASVASFRLPQSH